MTADSSSSCQRLALRVVSSICVVIIITNLSLLASGYFNTDWHTPAAHFVQIGSNNGKQRTVASVDFADLQIAFDSLVQVSEELKHMKKVAPVIKKTLNLIGKYLPSQKSGGRSRSVEKDSDQAEVNTMDVNSSVTILLNLVTSPLPQNPLSTKMVQNLARLHGNVTIVCAVLPSTNMALFEAIPNIVVLKFTTNVKPGEVWNRLIRETRTPYVLLARGVMFFDEDARPKRMLGILRRKDIGVVGGAFRYPGGHWFIGCQQYVMRNYTLSYSGGYFSSDKSCLFCQHVDGPFMARTALMKAMPFHTSFLSEQIVFADFFLRLNRQEKSQAMVCPDSMFHVYNNTDHSRESWTPLARKWELNVINIGSERIPLRCSDLPASCNKYSGRGLSPCCMQDIADQIKFLARTCAQNNITISLNAGTMLGAIKFGGILPWELDADVSFARENSSAVLARSLWNYFKETGYTVRNYSNKKRVHIDLHRKGSSWKLEFNGLCNYAYMKGGAIYDALHIKQTLVNLDGEWIPTVSNPGLNMFNNYKPELYKHSQHNVDYGLHYARRYVGARSFRRCSKVNHHSCLSQFNLDGNLQFLEPKVQNFCNGR